MYRNKITVGMEIWIHSHHETGEMIDWEPFSVTGERIPSDLIGYLFASNGKRIDDDMDTFSELETEKPYYIILVMEWEPGDEDCGGAGWYIGSLEGHIEIPIPELGLET